LLIQGIDTGTAAEESDIGFDKRFRRGNVSVLDARDVARAEARDAPDVAAGSVAYPPEFRAKPHVSISEGLPARRSVGHLKASVWQLRLMAQERDP
jgi:hypothetical protein